MEKEIGCSTLHDTPSRAFLSTLDLHRRGSTWRDTHFTFCPVVLNDVCFAADRELAEWKAKVCCSIVFCDNNTMQKDIQRDNAKCVLHDQTLHI